MRYLQSASDFPITSHWVIMESEISKTNNQEVTNYEYTIFNNEDEWKSEIEKKYTQEPPKTKEWVAFKATGKARISTKIEIIIYP